MNRLPRRPPRIQPPLRGRLAAASSLGQTPLPTTTVRSVPSTPRLPLPQHPPMAPPVCEPQPDWLDFYKQRAKFFSRLDRLWKWLIVLAILLSGSFLIGKLL
ncbi:MAG: hypothetical protein ACTS3T_23715 [Almyronema sp.]